MTMRWELWDTAEIAARTGYGPDAANFPKPIQFGKQALRWISEEVSAYAEARKPPPPKPTALYRHFGATGRLLYVGISINPMRRLSQHAVGAEWYREVATVKIEWLESVAAALEAEAAAIVSENPVYNKDRPGC